MDSYKKSQQLKQFVENLDEIPYKNQVQEKKRFLHDHGNVDDKELNDAIKERKQSKENIVIFKEKMRRCLELEKCVIL